MFTGLVETTAVVRTLDDTPHGRRVTLARPGDWSALALGDSVCINGCCLTAVVLDAAEFAFDAGPETLTKTNLGDLSVGDPVNLERALRADGRLGGHIVQGHVDGTATVAERQADGEWETFRFATGALADQLVPKGSVAVDGVSLTVVDVGADWFTVALIPHTLAETTLGRRRVGDTVNVETDVLGKYVMKYLSRLAGTPALSTVSP